jgi:hypothetical protein
MTKPIDKITAHFRSKISGELHKIHVKEWDMDIYYKGTNSLQEESVMIELAQKGKTIEALVETLIIKARHEDGTKMFKKIDKATFMAEADPQVLIRVCGEMNAVSADETLENAEKN